MSPEMFNNNVVRPKINGGWGTIEVLVLILVIGIIALIVINGMTTTVVVVEEVNDKDKIEKLATGYLNAVYDKAKTSSFYDSMTEGDFPPIPMTSVYTDSGRYSVFVETENESDNSKKISISYRKVASTSYSEPVMVLSTIIEDPETY